MPNVDKMGQLSKGLNSESSSSQLCKVLTNQFSATSKWQELLNTARHEVPRKERDGSFRGRVLQDWLINNVVTKGSKEECSKQAISLARIMLSQNDIMSVQGSKLKSEVKRFNLKSRYVFGPPPETILVSRKVLTESLLVNGSS